MTEMTSRRSRVSWRIVVYYLLAFGSGGAIAPFLSLYLREVGLTGNEIGVMQGWTAFIATFLTPLVGILADRTQRHRLVMALAALAKGISAPLMLLGNAWLWLTSLVSLRVIGASAHDAVLNRLTLEQLLALQRRNIGSVRLWGGASFAAVSLLAGLLAEGRSVSVLFPLAGVLGVAAVFFVNAFPAQIEGRGTAPRLESGLLNRSPLLLFFFAIVFLYTLGISGPKTFTTVFLAEDLGAGNHLIGAVGAASSLAPIPAYYLADRLIHRRGVVRTMAVGFALRIFSFLCYALLQSPALALPLTVADYSGTALYLISMVILLGELSAPDSAATDQMLAQLTVPGLAGMVAQPVSGRIFDALGPRVMFVASAAAALLALGLLLLRAEALRSAAGHQVDEPSD